MARTKIIGSANSCRFEALALDNACHSLCVPGTSCIKGQTSCSKCARCAAAATSHKHVGQCSGFRALTARLQRPAWTGRLDMSRVAGGSSKPSRVHDLSARLPELSSSLEQRSFQNRPQGHNKNLAPGTCCILLVAVPRAMFGRCLCTKSLRGLTALKTAIVLLFTS